MATLMGSWLGPGLVLLFCVSQAFRDVYFGHVFQDVDFFVVILMAFVLSTVIFTVVAWLRTPGAFHTLRGRGGTVMAINVTTALAWSCYFAGLTRLEPAIVNTLHSGMGPLTVVALAAFGARLAKIEEIGWGEYFGHSAIAISLLALWWVVLSGSSGLRSGPEASDLLGLALLLASGSSITISLLYCKRLHDQGVSAEVVTAVRYIALILIAGGVVLHRGEWRGITTLGEAASLSGLATILIVLPLYALQVGIALTAPLTAHVLRSLGPAFVFVLQQFDGRLTYSTPTLICILAYSTAAIACNVVHGLRQAHAGDPARVAGQPAHLPSTGHRGETCGRTLVVGNGASSHPRLAVQAAPVGHRPETRGQADHGLGAAEHQEAVALRDVGNTFEHVDLGDLIEVDQHIAAEHHVEAPER
jgi:drug/metabolite transporter (DMT)-like permease